MCIMQQCTLWLYQTGLETVWLWSDLWIQIHWPEPPQEGDDIGEGESYSLWPVAVAEEMYPYSCTATGGIQ